MILSQINNGMKSWDKKIYNRWVQQSTVQGVPITIDLFMHCSQRQSYWGLLPSLRKIESMDEKDENPSSERSIDSQPEWIDIYWGIEWQVINESTHNQSIPTSDGCPSWALTTIMLIIASALFESRVWASCNHWKYNYWHDTDHKN